MAEDLEKGAEGSLPAPSKQDSLVHELASIMQEIRSTKKLVDICCSTTDTKSISHDDDVLDPVKEEKLSSNFIFLLPGGWQRDLSYDNMLEKKHLSEDDWEFYKQKMKTFERIDQLCDEYGLDMWIISEIHLRLYDLRERMALIMEREGISENYLDTSKERTDLRRELEEYAGFLYFILRREGFERELLGGE